MSLIRLMGQYFFGALVNGDDLSSSDDTIRLNAGEITIDSTEVSLTTSGSNGHPLPLCSTKNTMNLDICIVSALFVCIMIKSGQNKAENVCTLKSCM